VAWDRRRAQGKASPAGLVSRVAADIQPEAIEWLWPHRFAVGKCSLTAGDGDLGKTTLLLGMAAAITRGVDWPAGEGKAPLGSVLYFSTEDGPADTIVPRLMAADADLRRVHLVTSVRRDDGKGERAFQLQEDLARLEGKIKELGDVRLVIFDPLSAYFGKTDTYRNSEVRAVLGPVADMAARNRVAIVGNTHFAKGGTGSANMRILDSVAITAQARTVYVVTKDPDDPGKRLFLPSKGNLGPQKQGLRFHIEAVPVRPGIEGTKVVWDAGDVKRTADEALADLVVRKERQPALKDAAKWLKEFLAGGPRSQAEIFDHAVADGLHSEKTLFRARKFIGVIATKRGMAGGWVWSLPSDPRDEFEIVDVPEK
jgi:putative DNA primase/helicase